MFHRVTCLVTVLFALGCAGAGKPAAVEAPPPEGEVPDAGRVVRADNQFGSVLFQELFNESPQQNVFISPPSVAMAMAMAWNGARGATRDMMATTLGLGGMAPEEVNRVNAALLAGFASGDKAVTLDVANSIWARKGIPLADAFIKANTESYGARVTELDFAAPEAVATINKWVSDRTRGRIPSIVNRLEAADVMLLVNAVYFKGTWTEQFDKQLTRDREFRLPSGEKTTCPMMAREDEFRYREADGFQAVRLPYGEGNFAMYVFLPVAAGAAPQERPYGEPVQMPPVSMGLEELVARFSPEELDRWVGEMQLREGEVVLPRFKLEYAKTLNDVLGRMGMDIAFDPARADFYGMLPAPVDMPFYINEVLHKSFVEVNEEGTEAAAVTSVKMAMTAMPSEGSKFVMTCDHPFLYLIRDDRSGAVLFLGAVNNPAR